jgi:flavin reductase (DIM6/NTAB) family NADH-FMN oxidoreductase RutF
MKNETDPWRFISDGEFLKPEISDTVQIRPKILYFGTPVVLIATADGRGNVNLSPMSSAWALGNTVVLGLSVLGKTLENLKATGECTLNFPDQTLWRNVEKLAPLTGKNPVPFQKMGTFRYESDKFSAASLHPVPSEVVKPPRVKECEIQMECTVRNIYDMGEQDGQLAAIVETNVIAVYANKKVILDDTHVNVKEWKPLIYSFRHYFTLGDELGKSFRSET